MKKIKVHHLTNFKYPKLTLLSLSVVLAYFMFRNVAVKEFISNSIASSEAFSYIGIFVAGLFFSFGFTAPFSVGFFIDLNTSNILAAALLGGFGALISDMLIFSFIRFSFKEEFKRLKKTKLFIRLNGLFKRNIGHKIRTYLIYFSAGFLIASPLPDEFGVTLLAGLSHIKPLKLAIISFILNSLGILILLFI